MSDLFHKTLPLLFVLLTMMTACDNASKQSPPSVVEAQKGFYKHLKGTIGDYPVTMDLVKSGSGVNNGSYESWAGFSGYYSYDKYQEPIALYGSYDSTGTLVLEEWAAEGGSAQFRGNITPEGTFIGTWQDSAKAKTLNVVLKQTNTDGAISLDNVEYGDSFRLFERLKNSPIALFGMNLLLPAPNTEASTVAFLKNEIFSNMRYERGGEEMPNPPLPKKNYANVSLTDLQKTQRDSFFAYFKEDMKDEKPDSSADSFQRSYTRSSEMQVIFNEKDLLSIAYSEFIFSGGAHGSHATTLASYDLTTKKQLALTDIFKLNYQAPLSILLEKALRKKYKLNPNEPLSQFLFENTIAANNNFAVTRKGILFDYPPYEIAAYAMGEIQLFIPFDDLKAVLK